MSADSSIEGGDTEALSKKINLRPVDPYRWNNQATLEFLLKNHLDEFIIPFRSARW